MFGCCSCAVEIPYLRGELGATSIADVATTRVHPVHERPLAGLAEHLVDGRHVHVRNDQDIDIEVLERARSDVGRGDRARRQVPTFREEPAEPPGRLVVRRAVRVLEDRDVRHVRRQLWRRRLRLQRQERGLRIQHQPGRATRHVHQQRVAPGRDVVGDAEGDVGVLVQHGLDPVLLPLRHRDPVRPDRECRRLRSPGSTA